MSPQPKSSKAKTTVRTGADAAMQMEELRKMADYLLEENEQLWQRMETIDQLRELTTEEQDVALRQVTKMFYKNPLGRAAIRSVQIYVTGGGEVQFTADDENPDVGEAVKKFWIADKWSQRLKELVRRLLREGEVFIRLFRGEDGTLSTRFVNADEITDIERDPDDAEVVVNYQRTYMRKTQKSGGIESQEKKTDVIAPNDMIHATFETDLNQKRGRPYLEPVLEQLTNYVKWLNSRTILNQIKANIVLERIIKGVTGEKVSSHAAQWEDSTRTTRRTTVKRVPPPGTMIDHSENVEYKFLSPDVKADDAKEDGRAIRLAIAGGLNLPEYLLTADASNANYASTLVSESPFVKFIEDLQEVVTEILKQLMQYVIQHAIDKGLLPKTSQETKLTEKTALRVASLQRQREWVRADQQLYEELTTRILQEQADDEAVEVESIPTKTTVSFEWPPIVTRDLLKDTQALVIHKEIGVASEETLAQKLGYDYQEEQRRIKKEEEAKPKPPPPPPMPFPPPLQPPPDEEAPVEEWADWGKSLIDHHYFGEKAGLLAEE